MSVFGMDLGKSRSIVRISHSELATKNTYDFHKLNSMPSGDASSTSLSVRSAPASLRALVPRPRARSRAVCVPPRQGLTWRARRAPTTTRS